MAAKKSRKSAKQSKSLKASGAKGALGKDVKPKRKVKATVDKREIKYTLDQLVEAGVRGETTLDRIIREVEEMKADLKAGRKVKIPIGFTYKRDYSDVTPEMIRAKLDAQIGQYYDKRHPEVVTCTPRQFMCVLNLWRKGDSRTEKEERLFAAFMNDRLIDETRRIGREELAPDEPIGTILTGDFFVYGP
jgi:hypothetical protein